MQASEIGFFSKITNKIYTNELNAPHGVTFYIKLEMMVYFWDASGEILSIEPNIQH